jgi:hypothetical protein
MRTIWKYPVQQLETFTFKLPKGARILAVDVQLGRPQMWISVESTEPFEERKFFIAMTGQEIPQDLYGSSDYLGTFQLNEGDLVLHLFEVLDPVTALVKSMGW